MAILGERGEGREWSALTGTDGVLARPGPCRCALWRGDHVGARHVLAFVVVSLTKAGVQQVQGDEVILQDMVRERGSGVVVGMVVSMRADVVMSLHFLCNIFVSGFMAWSSGVSPDDLTRFS
jgi:hypothetical protein